MMLALRKRVLFCLLYGIYFLFYAASPLSYSYSTKNSLNNTCDKSSIIRKDIHVFYWELLCKKFFVEEATSNQAASFKIFLRKKRAITPDNDPTNSKLQKNISIVGNSFSPSSYSLSSSAVASSLLKPTKYFLSSSSGLSPPLS